MAKGRQRDIGLESHWRGVVGRRRQSGLSVRAFCAREGLTESTHRAWERIIKERDLEQRPACNGSALPVPAFLPVVVAGASGWDCSGQIVIELRGGRRMRLAASMPAEQLMAVIRAVEGAA
jgi:hypothetical protein